MMYSYYWTHQFIVIVDQLANLKEVLLDVFSNPLQLAKDLFNSGVLSKQSYLTIKYLVRHSKMSHAGKKLIPLLFYDLNDPTRYDKFKEYSRIKVNQSYGLVSSMGE